MSKATRAGKIKAWLLKQEFPEGHNLYGSTEDIRRGLPWKSSSDGQQFDYFGNPIKHKDDEERNLLTDIREQKGREQEIKVTSAIKNLRQPPTRDNPSVEAVEASQAVDSSQTWGKSPRKGLNREGGASFDDKSSSQSASRSSGWGTSPVRAPREPSLNGEAPSWAANSSLARGKSPVKIKKNLKIPINYSVGAGAASQVVDRSQSREKGLQKNLQERKKMEKANPRRKLRDKRNIHSQSIVENIDAIIQDYLRQFEELAI